jgi:hypothetical protein
MQSRDRSCQRPEVCAVAPHFAVLCAASGTWRAQLNSTPDGRVTTTNREHRRIIPIIPAIEATSQARG